MFFLSFFPPHLSVSLQTPLTKLYHSQSAPNLDPYVARALRTSCVWTPPALTCAFGDCVGVAGCGGVVAVKSNGIAVVNIDCHNSDRDSGSGNGGFWVYGFICHPLGASASCTVTSASSPMIASQC